MARRSRPRESSDLRSAPSSPLNESMPTSTLHAEAPTNTGAAGHNPNWIPHSNSLSVYRLRNIASAWIPVACLHSFAPQHDLQWDRGPSRGPRMMLKEKVEPHRSFAVDTVPTQTGGAAPRSPA
eukprot:3710099-Pyramimonas_sp.AAC.1